jgi:uncharacterized membrane protein
MPDECLTHWLGKFHPPSVHFPVALITAAAVAEMLRMATRNPAFDIVSRFCICFGALTAVTAGILGWFLGGFRLTDMNTSLLNWQRTDQLTNMNELPADRRQRAPRAPVNE